MNWSGGKDSALALFKAQREGIPVDRLLTTVNAETDRISMHGVPCSLLKQQAVAMGLSLRTVELPATPGMQAYETTMQAAHRDLKSEGYTHGIFGDIFLEDLKAYREKLLATEGLACLFPLWNHTSKDVVAQYLQSGFQAVVVCVNSAFLHERFCGRLLDESFFSDLPPGVDPCGENGEYHSFVFDGPIFSRPIDFKLGEVVYREYPSPKGADDCFATPKPASGFYFCDLLPL
ncbi:adenine nucleotide alpha hydrolase [Flavisolibacter sp. BT320]|nr:adenine nucleotide alpha hydrolase [Flavisolibacter longurius]